MVAFLQVLDLLVCKDQQAEDLENPLLAKTD